MANVNLIDSSNIKVTQSGNNISLDLGSETVVDSIRTKNMFDKSTIVQQNREGNYSTNRLSTRQVLFLEAGTYTFSTNMPNTYNYELATFPNPLPNNESFIYDSGWQSSGTLTFTLSSSGYFAINFKKSDGSNLVVSDINSYNFQLETGSTATTYVPYQNLNGISQIITGSATVNSTYISNAENNVWERIGKVVVYHFTLTVTGTWDHTTQFLSNLPKPISYTRFIALDSFNNEPLRIAIDTSGKAYNAWSYVTPSSGHIIEGLVTYITSE